MYKWTIVRWTEAWSKEAEDNNDFEMLHLLLIKSLKDMSFYFPLFQNYKKTMVGRYRMPIFCCAQDWNETKLKEKKALLVNRN